MRFRMQRQRWVAVICLTVCSVARGQTAPRSPSADIPLWQLPPFDRLELVNNDVHDIDAVRIPAGELGQPEAEVYVGRPGLPPFKEIYRPAFYRIRLQDDGLEYDVQGKSIRKITYYEDLLLVEAKRLTAGGKFDEAFEYLVTLLRLSPQWPGLLVARIDYYREESTRFSAAGNWEPAFWSLAEEKRLRAEYAALPEDERGPESFGAGTLADRLESVSRRWLERALADRRYDDARRTIARIESVSGESDVARNGRQTLDQLADDLLASAAAKQSDKNYRGALADLDQAKTILPDAPRVRGAVESLHGVYPVLRVAVDRLPSFRGSLAHWSRADERAAQLLHVPLMRLESLDNEGTFTSNVIASLEKANINKQATVRLRGGLVWPGDVKLVTAIDLQRLLADSCRPGSPLYHPALSRLVVDLQPEYPDVLRIQFDRPQFQPAAWLQLPFLRIGHDPGIQSTTVGNRLGFSGLGPFRLAELRGRQGIYVANPRYFQSDQPIIQQLTEQYLPTTADRLRALQDGSVDMVAFVPPSHHKQVLAIPHARLVRQSLPRVHVIQFNLQRRELRHRALRRAMDYAIDRVAICGEVGVVLDDENRLVTGPLPFGSFGYNGKVEQRPHDPFLARSLVSGVRKELQTLPPLKIAHSGDETSRAACERIAASWRKAGLSIAMIDLDADPSQNPLDADLWYQSHTISDPIYDTITLLSRDNPTLAEQGTPWFRQRLVELIDVPNLAAASTLLPEIHRLIHEDVVLLPLWQWTEHFAVGPTVEGTEAAPPSTYHGIVQWKVSLRYPESHWTTKLASQ